MTIVKVYPVAIFLSSFLGVPIVEGLRKAVSNVPLQITAARGGRVVADRETTLMSHLEARAYAFKKKAKKKETKSLFSGRIRF
jgi:hypothetical protein